MGFVRMGREHSAYQTDAAGLQLTAAGAFEGGECSVMVGLLLSRLDGGYWGR